LKTQTFEISDIQPESSDVFTYRCPYQGNPLVFLPGQFVVAQRKPEGKKASVTFSSPPSDREGFSFTLKRTGTFGTDFCDNAKVGDTIEVTRPTGSFALDVSQRRPVCFIGRDYTVSAARSALLEREARFNNGGRRPRGKFFLLHELSSPEERIFDDEFQRDIPGFFCIPTLDPTYRGETSGLQVRRVTAEFIKENVPQLHSTEFYVCAEGVDAKFFKAELKNLELKKELVHIERWS
jgi:ferredoxin-NADP reductase